LTIMKEILEIKWPWEMVWSESVDDFIAVIKEALPSDHPLRDHDLYPGIKWSGRPIFIIDNDTTGEIILMDFERMSRWKRTKRHVPHIRTIKNMEELQEIINRDHSLECSKHSE
jgi:hypothetical protein